MIDNYEEWKKAGKIAAEALEYGKSLVKNGANVREVCDQIDQKIIDLGALPAWPTQVGIDSVAAHYTPDPDDDQVFDNHVVSLDVGAHVDGFVGDNAWTVDLSGKWTDIIKAAKDALAAAEKVIGVGVELGTIGKEIQEAMESHGASPIKNLSGHGINRWVIHDKPSVPNFDNGSKIKLQEGQIIAIEPFATNGMGMIYETDRGNLFALKNKKPVRSPFAREALQFIETNYGALPFTTRWLTKEFGKGKTTLAIRELMNADILRAYPPLVEKAKGTVAVFEKTFLISDKVEVMTKI